MPNALTTSPASIAPAVPEQNAWLDRPVEAGTYTALYLLKEEAFHDVFSPEERADISSRVKVHPRLLTPEAYEASTEVWPEIEMIFSGWGMVVADEAFFERFPRLKMIFYAAGTVRCFVTDALWRRNVQLTNAGAANAIPVCEYTLSQILFALKHGWQKALYIRRHHAFPPRYHAPGAYRGCSRSARSDGWWPRNSSATISTSSPMIPTSRPRKRRGSTSRYCPWPRSSPSPTW